MLPLDKILLPVDFSDRSAAAARQAVRLAAHFHSEITVLHVLPPMVAPPHEYPELYVGAVSRELYRERRERAERNIDEMLKDVLRYPRVARIVEEGDPPRKIVDCAHAGKFGLILMPTHGYGPFRRLLLGSVTAKVLHDADCPVWTSVHAETPAPIAEDVHFKHVMCAVDLGPQSEPALKWASAFAAEFKARLSLVHVVGLDPRTEAYYFSPEWRAQILDAAKGEIGKLQASAGTDAEVHLEVGDVHNAVVAEAESAGADLLVTGRTAKAGVFGRLPTHAYAIVRDAKCPVVSV